MNVRAVESRVILKIARGHILFILKKLIDGGKGQYTVLLSKGEDLRLSKRKEKNQKKRVKLPLLSTYQVWFMYMQLYIGKRSS